MQKRNYIDSIRNVLSSLGEFDKERLFRNSLGSQSLEGLGHDFRNIIEKCTRIIESTVLDEISLSTIQDIDRVLNEIYIIFNRVSQFDDVSFVTKRSGTLNDIQVQLDSLKKIWQSIGWMFEKEINNSADEEFQKAQQINAELQTELANVRTLANSLEQQAEEYKTRYSNINVNVELETQVNVFKTQSEKNRQESVKWFWGILGSAVVLFITLTLIYCKSGLPADFFFDYTFYNNVCETCGEHVLWVDMLKHIFFKLLILSVEIYVLTFCVKNYNACMHNKTNNEHRHNSFAAALHFYNTTTGEKRDEILIKVADAIFTYQKSGYYGKDSEPANPSLIQSVVDKVAGKG